MVGIVRGDVSMRCGGLRRECVQEQLLCVRGWGVGGSYLVRTCLSPNRNVTPCVQLKLKCDEMALKLEEAKKKLEELTPAEQ